MKDLRSKTKTPKTVLLVLGLLLAEFVLHKWLAIHRCQEFIQRGNNTASTIPFFYINLDSASDRRRNIETSFQVISKNLTRIKGVEARQEYSHLLHPLPGALPGRCENVWTNTPEPYDKQFWSALGCSLGHLKTISYLHRLNLSRAIIIEDDASIELLPFWTTSLDEFVSELPPRWSMVQLSLTGSADMWRDAHSKWQRQGGAVSKNRRFWGAVAYLISRRGINAIVGAYGLDRFDLSSLHCINSDVDLLKQADARGSYYIATPPLFTFTDTFASQVQITNQFTEFGQLPDHGRANVHFLSRYYAFEWNAQKWRRSILASFV
jgi:Glycosyltransferase family 25 (LPS biosynthesis protein)